MALTLFMITLDELTEFYDFEDTFDYGRPDLRPANHQGTCVLFHPMFLLPDHREFEMGNGDQTLLEKELAFDPESAGLKRIRWQDFVTKHHLGGPDGFEYDKWNEKLKGKWPSDTRPAAEGLIDKLTAQHLIRVIQKFTGIEERCFFFFDTPAVTDEEELELWRGMLPEVLSFGHEPRVRTLPTYWWPESKAWRVYTDNDLPFSFVTGSHEFVQALLASPDIECIASEPEFISAKTTE